MTHLLCFNPDFGGVLPGRSFRTGFGRLLALVLVLGLVADHAAAVTEGELIGPDLVNRSARITNLYDNSISYFDEQRNLQSAGLDEFIQLRIKSNDDADESNKADALIFPIIRLTDGQRFTGTHIGSTPDGSGLRWQNDLVGAMTFSLDEIASITWRVTKNTKPTNETQGSDTIAMINGDRLAGFVSSLNEQGVELIPNATNTPVTIPYERIASLVLANPVMLQTEPYHRVTLTDGSRLLVEQLQLSDDQVSWQFIPPGASPELIEMSVADLSQIDFGAGGFRLIGFGELPMRVKTEPDVFGLTIPVRVQRGLILAHAPAVLAFELPEGASRIAAIAELDVSDAPDHVKTWADFHIIISCDGQEISRSRLSGSQPVVHINAPVMGRELTLRLEPGVNGPILDRLRLRNAVVLVETPPAERSGDAGR